MRRYHRFIQLGGKEVRPSDQADLATILDAAPGASDVEVIGTHPKGGYRVRFDLEPEEFDAFLSHLEAAGWRSVI